MKHSKKGIEPYSSACYSYLSLVMILPFFGVGLMALLESASDCNLMVREWIVGLVMDCWSKTSYVWDCFDFVDYKVSLDE